MTTDGQAAIAIPAIAAFGHPCPSYAGAPVCVAFMDLGQGREQDAEALLVAYLEQLQKTSGQAMFQILLLHTMGKDEQVSRVQDAQELPLHPWR